MRPLAIAFVASATFVVATISVTWCTNDYLSSASAGAVESGDAAKNARHDAWVLVDASVDEQRGASSFVSSRSPVVTVGVLGDSRFISVGGGFVDTTDGFDAAGKMIGERRSSDAIRPHLWGSETAIYGSVPVVDESLPSRNLCLRDLDKSPKELYRPLWKSMANP